jgi:hypothetical protein
MYFNGLFGGHTWVRTKDPLIKSWNLTISKAFRAVHFGSLPFRINCLISIHYAKLWLQICANLSILDQGELLLWWNLDGT